MTIEAGQIYQLLPLVMSDLAKAGVGKGQVNKNQGYKFRGIDDLLNVCGPVLARHGVFVRPLVDHEEWAYRGEGNKMTHARLVMRYVFTAPDGSFIEVSTVGEAMDSHDKAGNKAMAAALKYALIQTFLIPIVGDDDGDLHSPQVEAKLATKPLEAIDRIELAILAALDKAALEKIAAELKGGSWSDEERARLRDAYGKRMKEVA